MIHILTVAILANVWHVLVYIPASPITHYASEYRNIFIPASLHYAVHK